mgnify:FL=1|tara:strand:+ start:410 stop:712 length:303 start_codon:yes stop_codon:yes gene_type:complete
MAGIYKRFAGAANEQPLITKGSGVSGNIRKILIANEDSAITKVTIDLHDGSTTFVIIREVEIPVSSSLVLSDNVSFDSNIFSLRITTSGTGTPTVTVIIK